MKRFLLFLIFFCGALAVSATQDTLRLGYCNGNLAASSDIQLTGSGWTECAIRLTPADIAAYRAKQIVGVRVALAARNNTDTLRVWVRRSLDDDNLAEAYVVRNGTSGVLKGWNVLSLDTPYTISDNDEELYIGYSLHQNGSVKAVSLVEREVEESSFIKLGTAQWQDVSIAGTLSIEALVAGNDFAKTDLGIDGATVSPVLQNGEKQVQVSLRVHNYGTQPVDKFTLAVVAGDTNTTDVLLDMPIASQADSTMTFTVLNDAAIELGTEWTVTLISVDTLTDQCAENNVIVANYRFLRNVLVEEFTTEQCHNCPRIAGYLSEVIGNRKYAGRLCAVAHHVGFQTDWLTLDGDDELLWLFNGSSYAPALTFDRSICNVTTTGTSTVVISPNSVAEIEAYVANCLHNPAEAILSLQLEFNADSTQLAVNIGGMCTSRYNTPTPRLVVYLLENNVAAHSQLGANGEFNHQHVTRACNGTWGEAVEWIDNNFEHNIVFNLDESWKKENMEVVALIFNYDSTDPTACGVDNAVCVQLVDNSTSTVMSPLEIPANARIVARYDALGRQVSDTYNGLTIVKMADGSVIKLMQ